MRATDGSGTPSVRLPETFDGVETPSVSFGEAGTWHVIDFKTDPELGELRGAYESQVRLYATAIGEATGCATTGTLLLV